MKIDIHGKRSYNFSKEKIYNCILGLPDIIKSFPVIDRVELTDNDTYVFTFSLNFGMYSGSYTGKLYIVEKREYNYLHLKATHQSRLGKLFVDVEVTINESASNENELSISGFFEVRGMMRLAGSHVLKNGVTTGLEIMFDFLERQLAEGKSPI